MCYFVAFHRYRPRRVGRDPTEEAESSLFVFDQSSLCEHGTLQDGGGLGRGQESPGLPQELAAIVTSIE